MKRWFWLSCCLGSVMSGVEAQELVIPVEVRLQHEAPVRWKEVESTRILSAKKNKATKTNVHPPIATDNMRQYFSQNAGIIVAEQSTEPWPAYNVRGVGDPHEAQNVLLLQDGLPMALDMYGASGNYVAPPAPLMEEIEQLHGGAALLYGPQPAGVLNFRTPGLKPQQPLNGKLGLTYGSYNLLSTVNSIKGHRGKTSYWAGFYRKQGDGYQRANADFWANHLQAKTHTYLENGDILKLSLTGYDSDYGQPGGMTRDCKALANANCWRGHGENRKASRSHDRLMIARAQGSVGHEKKIAAATVLESTFWINTYKRYSSTQTTTGSRFGTKPNGDSSDNRRTDAHGFNLESRLRHDWKMGEREQTLALGILSYNTNSPTTLWTGEDKQSIRGDVSGRTLNQSRVLALFAENRFNFGKWALVPGLRYENITLTTNDRFNDSSRQESFNVLLGGLGASYDLQDNLQAYANASQGFKPISFGTVLQQASATVEVEGDIKPSYIYNYEAGLRSDSNDWTWDVSGYWIVYQNQVASKTAGGITTITNGREAFYRGAEAAITRKNVLESGPHGLDLYLNGNYLHAEFKKGEFEGKSPLYTPHHTLKYGANYRHADKWRASLLATYVSAHFATDDHDQNFHIPSYHLFDLLGEVRLAQNWSVNGAINNLMDKTYYSRIMATGILPAMGRNYYLGANYQF